jgi:hypothetical protein
MEQRVYNQTMRSIMDEMSQLTGISGHFVNQINPELFMK